MKRIIVAGLVIVFATGAFGHTPSASGADIKPVSAALAPMPKPTLPLGTVLTWSTGRVDYSQTLVASDETTVTFKSNLGCIFTIDSHADFIGAPVRALKWTNCRRSSGTGSIKVI